MKIRIVATGEYPYPDSDRTLIVALEQSILSHMAAYGVLDRCVITESEVTEESV